MDEWNLYFNRVYNLFNINWGPWIDLGVDFREVGKTENPEKNRRSTGEIKNSTHICSKFDNQHETIPRWSPIQFNPVRPWA